MGFFTHNLYSTMSLSFFLSVLLFLLHGASGTSFTHNTDILSHTVDMTNMIANSWLFTHPADKGATLGVVLCAPGACTMKQNWDSQLSFFNSLLTWVNHHGNLNCMTNRLHSRLTSEDQVSAAFKLRKDSFTLGRISDSVDASVLLYQQLTITWRLCDHYCK